MEVRNRLSDRAGGRPIGIRSGQGAIRYVHGSLGDAVHVHQARLLVAVTRKPRSETAEVEGLSAEDHIPQGKLVRLPRTALLRRHQLVEGRGCLVQHRDALALQELVELLGRARREMGHDHELAPVEQGSPQLPHGEVEGEGMEHRPNVALVEAEPRLGRFEQPGHVAVTDQAALRLAGRPRGVDDVRKILGGNAAGWILVRLAGDLILVFVETHQAGLDPGQRALRLLFDHRDRSARVFADHHGARRRDGGVERHVGAARLENGKAGQRKPRRAL